MSASSTPLLAKDAKEGSSVDASPSAFSQPSLSPRVVPRRSNPRRFVENGAFRMGRRVGANMYWQDFYHYMLRASWKELAVWLVVVYLVISTAFAVLYYFLPGDIVGDTDVELTSFADIFLFAARVMADLDANGDPSGSLQVIFLIEGIFQLVALALMVGVIIDRLTHPQARVRFSRKALLSLYDGKLTFMFRAANERDSPILDAEIRLFLVRSFVTKEGHTGRRAQEIELTRNQMPVFHMMWNLFHVVDKASPFYGLTAAQMIEEKIEAYTVFKGTESTANEEIRIFHSYVTEDITLGGKFEDMLSWTDDDVPNMDLRKIDSVIGGDPNWNATLTEDVDEVLGAALKEELMGPSRTTPATAATVNPVSTAASTVAASGSSSSATSSSPIARPRGLRTIFRAAAAFSTHNLMRENSDGAGDLSCAGLDHRNQHHNHRAQLVLHRAAADASPAAADAPDVEEGGGGIGGGATAGGADAAGGVRLRGSLN